MEKTLRVSLALSPARPEFHSLVLSWLPLLADLNMMKVMYLQNFAEVQENSELGIF